MASYVQLEKENSFSIIYSNLFLLNLQMCEIILTPPLYRLKGFQSNHKVVMKITQVEVYTKIKTGGNYSIKFLLTRSHPITGKV